MKTLAVVAKKGSAEAAVLARRLRQRHPELTLLADPDFAAELGWPVASQEEVAARAELVVVLGGDGTLIRAARLLGGRPVPILGINLGSLGFMTEVPATEGLDVLDEVLAGRGSVQQRMKLGCRVVRRGTVAVEDEVLNDVVINRGALSRIADHETRIDGKLIATFKSDGLIVATPTGSTAYALAAGGPIVHPGLDCALIVPICPHALTQRPLVVPGDQVVSIHLGEEAADIYVTFDGQSGHALLAGDTLEVRRSPNRVLLVSNPRLDYFAVLREKLHWGAR
ncbi:MAG: NAD(+)/NADH kinase [Myxococcaceae bacterium]